MLATPGARAEASRLRAVAPYPVYGRRGALPTQQHGSRRRHECVHPPAAPSSHLQVAPPRPKLQPQQQQQHPATTTAACLPTSRWRLPGTQLPGAASRPGWPRAGRGHRRRSSGPSGRAAGRQAGEQAGSRVGAQDRGDPGPHEAAALRHHQHALHKTAGRKEELPWDRPTTAKRSAQAA